MKLETIVSSIKIAVLGFCFLTGALHLSAADENTAATPAPAETTAQSGGFMDNPLVKDISSTVLFGFLGVIMAVMGFKLFDWIIPADLEDEITNKQNVAVAVLCSGMLIAVGVIIAATIASP